MRTGENRFETENTSRSVWTYLSEVFGMERETGFEPATSTLARSHSTTELFPPCRKGILRSSPSRRQDLEVDRLPLVLYIVGSGQPGVA